MLGQLSSQGSGLLDSEIQRSSLSLVVLSDGLSLRLVDDGEDSGNVLSDVVDLGDFRRSTSGDLLDSQGSELLLEFLELLHQLGLVLRTKGVCGDLVKR